MPTLASRMDRRIMIQQPIADTALDGAGSGEWGDVGEVWAEVQDAPPSRGERLADGISVSQLPARVRIRYRDDVTSDMRFVMAGRIMQIVGGPAELGRREALEFMVVEYRPGGNTA